jgi:hypothetical protein
MELSHKNAFIIEKQLFHHLTKFKNQVRYSIQIGHISFQFSKPQLALLSIKALIIL